MKEDKAALLVNDKLEDACVAHETCTVKWVYSIKKYNDLIVKVFIGPIKYNELSTLDSYDGFSLMIEDYGKAPEAMKDLEKIINSEKN
jgi:hypothetical protein